MTLNELLKAQVEMTPREKASKSKRKRDGDGPSKQPLAKRQRAPTPPIELNQRPTQVLNIYVFGENSAGELGLGPEIKSGTVSRPRLNPYLSGSAGVVQVALGAMHGVALTSDNKILTWGVNDHGALGRDTTWEGNLVDADNDDDDDDDSDDGELLNPRESTPTAVDMSHLPAGINFTQVAATDNATFALTSTGFVYGWGTFRSEDGKVVFSPGVESEFRPVLIPSIEGVVKLSCGSNHVLALTADGSLYTWGRANDGQLGHRVSRRAQNLVDGLRPRRVGGIPRMADIGSGANHSFAIDLTGAVYGWGFNNAGQVGVEWGHESLYVVPTPTCITGLQSFSPVTQITGGNFHTIAITGDGRCLGWGRLYSHATGLAIASLPDDNIIRDSRMVPDYTGVPALLKGVSPSLVAAASEHTLAVQADHQIYTWGLNLTKQLAQRDEEVTVPTLLRHKSIDGKKIVWAGTGAQFSMLGEVAALASTVPN